MANIEYRVMTELIHTLRKYNRWSDELFFERYDLQLFAAEDEGRTEEPTEKKLREAREKGQVAKTVELPQAIVVFRVHGDPGPRLMIRHHPGSRSIISPLSRGSA